jgi:lysozyme
MYYSEMLLWLKKNEGFKSHPYLDTSGKVTIGYGRNLDDGGISPEEADYLLRSDLNIAIESMEEFTWFHDQPEDIQDALINMSFNMGITRLKGFKQMLDAIEKKDYATAAMEALDSDWASEVGQRAKDIAVMIREAK